MYYPYQFNVPTSGFPTNLGVIFTSGYFYARVAVTLPAAYRGSASFPFCIMLACNPAAEVVMFVQGQKVPGFKINDMINLAFDQAYNRDEIIQDLKAIEVWDKFPELEEML